ncbi:MAG: hypothetical protein WC364_13225 [Eubacteriales bacterium]|jgi:hypothetical protein
MEISWKVFKKPKPVVVPSVTSDRIDVSNNKVRKKFYFIVLILVILLIVSGTFLIIFTDNRKDGFFYIALALVGTPILILLIEIGYRYMNHNGS